MRRASTFQCDQGGFSQFEDGILQSQRAPQLTHTLVLGPKHANVARGDEDVVRAAGDGGVCDSVGIHAPTL